MLHIKLGWENKNPHTLPTTFVAKTQKMQKGVQKWSVKYEDLWLTT
jgi:hypothetical protein